MPAMKDIPSHFVTEYSTNWDHLAQQKMAKTRECVVVENFKGKEKKFNQMAASEMDPVTVRAGDTRISDTDLPARWLRPYPLDKAFLFDEWDNQFLGEVVLPQSESRSRTTRMPTTARSIGPSSRRRSMSPTRARSAWTQSRCRRARSSR